MTPIHTRAEAGIDEVGRGCLAGPVVAAMIAFRDDPPEGIRDSKRLSKTRLLALDEAIRGSAWVSIGQASVAEIDSLNILHATMLAMRRAHDGINAAAVYRTIAVDGDRIPDGMPSCTRAVVRGDAVSTAIAAASIVAKVHRDTLMTSLSDHHPLYGWSENKGYGTARHVAALASEGATRHHRASFAPVARVLEGRQRIP